MAIKRIVSFLPSATELLYEFKVQDRLFGVTHQCNYPNDAKQKPQVVSSVINSEKLSSKEIDTMTCSLLNQDKEIFQLNEENVILAAPDLIISQETCKVCAAHTNQVKRAIQILQKKPILYSMDPHNVKEILDSVRELGKILEKETEAKQIITNLENRINLIKKIHSKTKPKVLAIEWIEPFFTASHWIPEMIEIAGGINLISKKEEHSRRLDIKEIIKSEPDLIIMMPCGFDVQRTISEYDKILKKNKEWNGMMAVKQNRVYAVDANSFFSKPSIRTIDGIEILAKIIQPQHTGKLRTSYNSFAQIF